MKDFTVEEFAEAFAALGVQGAALGRYGSLVSEQSAAVEIDDIDRVDALALELDGVIADLDDGGRRLGRFQQMLVRCEVSGPRAAALRREMLQLADGASAIERTARSLARQLVARRNAVGAELAQFDQRQRAAARYDVPTDDGGGGALGNTTA